MSSTLMLHCGAREVDRAALALVPTPEPTATWFPVGHAAVVDSVTQQLDSAGFSILKARFGLSRGDARLFATLDLESRLADGVALAVGVRNSLDKTLPLGFVAGSRTFVCDNLSFSSELMVARKHTRFGEERFVEAISLAVKSLEQFHAGEVARIEDMRTRRITDMEAESLILRAFEADIISTRMLPDVLQEWRKPTFEEFSDRTAWSLYSAFTTVLRPRALSNAPQHAALTIRLGSLFGGDGAALASPVPIATVDGIDVFEPGAFDAN
jgi:hypothetical protein